MTSLLLERGAFSNDPVQIWDTEDLLEEIIPQTRTGSLTPLIQAALAGREEIVRILVSHGADIGARDMRRVTALAHAVRNDHPKCIDLLLEAGSNPNAKDEAGTTPLMIAAKTDRMVNVHKLVSYGADLNSMADDGTTLLSIAGIHKSRDLDMLLAYRGTLQAFARDSDLSLIQPLDINAVSVDVHKCLRSTGMKPDAEYPAAELHPTIFAFRNKMMLALKVMIWLGADPDCKSKYGDTALHMAIVNGNVEMVSYLLKKGASTDVKNSAGESPLHIAVRWGKLSVINNLIEAGADVNASGCDLRGRTPCHDAVISHDLDAMKALLNVGADASKCDHEGSSPLLEAAIQGGLATAELLVKSGADVCARDSLGWTPAHWAAFGSYGTIVCMLVDAGADLNARVGGTTVLDHALRDVLLQILKHLGILTVHPLGHDVEEEKRQGTSDKWELYLFPHQSKEIRSGALWFTGPVLVATRVPKNYHRHFMAVGDGRLLLYDSMTQWDEMKQPVYPQDRVKSVTELVSDSFKKQYSFSVQFERTRYDFQTPQRWFQLNSSTIAEDWRRLILRVCDYKTAS